jgi:outer membrane protein TolC
MLRAAQGRRAMVPVAQIAAFAASAILALSAVALAAEPAKNSGNGRLVGGKGAGTMDLALVQAYQNNPQLNSQRSATRAIDENVPTALAGYRPRVSGTASLTDQYLDQLTRTTGKRPGSLRRSERPGCRPAHCRRLHSRRVRRGSRAASSSFSPTSK